MRKLTVRKGGLSVGDTVLIEWLDDKSHFWGVVDKVSPTAQWVTIKLNHVPPVAGRMLNLEMLDHWRWTKTRGYQPEGRRKRVHRNLRLLRVVFRKGGKDGPPQFDLE